MNPMVRLIQVLTLLLASGVGWMLSHGFTPPSSALRPGEAQERPREKQDVKAAGKGPAKTTEGVKTEKTGTESKEALLRFRGMAFKTGTVLGAPVASDCTQRCHIDFPFDLSRPFRHDRHGPKQGFPCRHCHDDAPAGTPRHGQLSIPGEGCKACHHDTKRFPRCRQCHAPVSKETRVDRLVFDHGKHVQTSRDLTCTECHNRLTEKEGPWPLDRCLDCHHASRAPLPCLRCHGGQTTREVPEKIPHFDHRLHAASGSEKGVDTCRDCHLSSKGRLVVPDSLPCAVCHHPADPAQGLACRRCHEEAGVDRRIRNPDFDHGLHARTVSPCTECHGSDSARSPARGLDCTRCHHGTSEDCRHCHGPLVRFEKAVPFLPEQAVFSHGLHQSRAPCLACHEPSAGLDAPLGSRDCATCHHQSGHGPACTVCHPEAGNIMEGRFPGRPNGPPDVMLGIVKCGECHVLAPGERSGLEEGTRSCLRCHPREYQALLAARITVLERLAGKRRLGGAATPLTPSLGIHNFPYALELLSAPPTPTMDGRSPDPP